MSELFPKQELPQTDEGCADITVEISAKELGVLLANYENERFRATCGWKNYNELKSEVEKAGYSPYNPMLLKEENEDLRKKVAELEDEIEERDKREDDRERVGASRKDTDEPNKRIAQLKSECDSLQQMRSEIYGVVTAHLENFGGPSASDAITRILNILKKFDLVFALSENDGKGA